MDIKKYLTVVLMMCLEGGETGGHGEKHHVHVKLHVPEFIHHDRHTKVVTIHHHHHKPKKEHHHHHHHHHKIPVPHGHHYHHHNKKSHSTSHTTSKGHHGHHVQHGHHKHPTHHGHHAHHTHGSKHGHHGSNHNGHHHDTPSVSYDPVSIPSFEDDFGSPLSPSVPTYGGDSNYHTPKVQGITHTVKQVKVYDSLPGVIPGRFGNANGYEVTEQGEEAVEDVFTSVNDLQQVYPATYGYLRGAGSQPLAHNQIVQLPSQNNIAPQNNDLFALQPASSSEGVEPFIGTIQADLFSSSAPLEPTSLTDSQQSIEYPGNFQSDLSLDSPSISFPGSGNDASAFTSHEDRSILGDGPVSFSREAGVQQTTKTGGVETVVY